jgi:hypothetical protein
MKHLLSNIKYQISFTLALVLFSSLLSARIVQAATPTLSPTPEPTSSVIQQIRDEVKKKVQEKIAEIQLGKKRGFFGEILEIGDKTITLSIRVGELKVNVVDDTSIIGLKKEKLTIDKLKTGDYVIAMGYMVEEGTLEAKRVVVITKPKATAREVAFGVISDISSEEKIITVKNERKQTSYTVEVTSETVITKKMTTKVEKVSFEDLAEQDRILAIGTPGTDSKKIITAKMIFVIPGKAVGQTTSTPSATPSPRATPEETTTPTPTPTE